MSLAVAQKQTFMAPRHPGMSLNEALFTHHSCWSNIWSFPLDSSTLAEEIRVVKTISRSQLGRWPLRPHDHRARTSISFAVYCDQASHGGVLVVSVVQRAFEALVGHKVAQTTIYRMLDLHDWRTIIPRPRHPKSNTEAQEGFKKTPENCG